MTRIDRLVVRVSRSAMLLILLAVAITLFEVVMRYAFDNPTTWAYKNTLWLGAIVYLVAGTYAMQRRSHIRITAVYDIVPSWMRMAFDYLSVFIIVVYTTLMMVGGTAPAFNAFMAWVQSGKLLDPSIAGTIKPLILITTTVVAIVAINNLLADHCRIGRHRKTSPADKGHA